MPICNEPYTVYYFLENYKLTEIQEEDIDYSLWEIETELEIDKYRTEITYKLYGSDEGGNVYTTDEDSQSIERTWQKHYFGRCICCGNGYDKDDWRWERTMFEEEYGYDEWEKMYNVAINEQQHEGNGVCFECADEIMKKLKLLKEAQKKKRKLIVVDSI